MLRILGILTLLCYFPLQALADDIFSDFANASQTRFSAKDVERFVAKYPTYMTEEMAMAFGIHTAKYDMDPLAIRDCLPEHVRQHFDKGYTLVKMP